MPDRADPASLIARIRAEAAAMDPDVPIAELSTLASYVSNAMSQTRFLLALIGAFAALALGLASLGLYGVISYSAKQRTRGSACVSPSMRPSEMSCG